MSLSIPCKAQSLFSGLILSERKEGLKIVGIQSGSPGHDAGLRDRRHCPGD